MIFSRVVGRAQIGELFAGSRDVRSQCIPIELPSDLPRLDDQSAAALWSSDPSIRPDLPQVLLTADGQERDWLAWLATFAPSLRPFTAFCRIMNSSSFATQFDAFQSPDLDRLAPACIGLVLGEVLSTGDALFRMREPLTASACASVLSFPLVRELAIHKQRVLDEATLPRRWVTVRQLTRQRDRGLDPREVASVAEILRALLRRDHARQLSSKILSACEELAFRGDGPSVLRELGPDFQSAAGAMKGTREERVEAFEHALGASKGGAGSQEEAFALGYLASRIRPGTLTHAALLAPALPQYPSAMLWYGVCAGLSEGSDILAEFNGVGRRVLRDLVAEERLVARPRADISAAELEMILGGDRPERADEFTVASPSQLSIELEPGITTIVNWSSRARSRQSFEGSERQDERTWIGQELGVAISRLVDLQRRLHGGDPHERTFREPEQGQRLLFDPNSASRRNKRR